MTPRQIDDFFRTLAGELDEPATAYLTGAGAGAIYGRIRPSLDVDFALEIRRKNRLPAEVEAAVARATRLTAIPANFAADIDRWGMISLLDYKRRAHVYRRYGRLTVKILDPLHWSIGKLTRYLDPDIEDVVQVFRRQRVPALAAAGLWGRALRASPASDAQWQFRRQVEAFLGRHGRRVWGRAFDAATSVKAFHRAARIRD
jgi:hypothetical protein